MDNMDEMDDVLRELEDGKNPLEVPGKSAKPTLRLHSLYAASIILFLIAVAARIAGNNVVFSAIEAAAVTVSVLLLLALGLLYMVNGDIHHKSNHSEKG
ncbi:MAG: hypothetical protein IJQ25_05010 [Oscillibacter sp.]|nr:hypothetical protein [Oscillibacter sp.]